ncbi:predicted protein [Enterococcus gallinarum EG2]|nr:predicted protein [Enterococcus gallinarum EG2]
MLGFFDRCKQNDSKRPFKNKSIFSDFYYEQTSKKALPDITNVYRVMLIDFLLSCMKSGVSLFHDQFLTNINDIIGQAIP